MARKATDLLTIQKFIFLLDDFHYAEFISYLESIRASLSFQLSLEIREKLPFFDSHERLCQKIYGSVEKSARQNFNQLSAHTFKLSSHLAQNYPGYLSSNISGLQRLVNNGEREQASTLADSLLDIAERVDDFQCQKAALQFLGQQADVNKHTILLLKLNEQLESVVETESVYIKMQTALRKTLHSETTLEKSELDKLKKHYHKFHNHSSPSVRMFSRFARLSCTYHFSPTIFSEQDVVCIRDLERDLKNFSHLVQPFMIDLKGNFGFIKLNSPFIHPNSKEGRKLFNELAEHYDSLKFWKSYLNTGQLYLTTISGTRLFSIYHPHIHKADYVDLIAENDRQLLRELLIRCEDWLKNITPVDNPFHFKGIKMLYGVFLIVSGEKNVKRGIEELETLLTTFQQVNLKGSTDSIFMCLMSGYFSIKDYKKCASTFNRFLKSSKGKPVFEGNELKIYSYYYISQWLATGGKQYAAKLHNMLYKNADETPPASILELVKYFQVF